MRHVDRTATQSRPSWRKRFAVILLVLVGLACTGAMTWSYWLPQYRPPLQRGERYGIDVSMHQGVVDWRSVAADNVHFAT
jgi:lysozyme